MSQNHVFRDAIERLKRIGSAAGISSHVLDGLENPKAVLSASLPVRMDDGRTHYFQGHRCHYNDILGPTKGGIRYHPDVSVEEVQALALWMTLKCSLAGLPYGGGKGGVRVNPKDLSPMELERLSRAYMQAMSEFVGPELDIPAPDVYTNARIMGWMADEYQTIKGYKAPGVITGKPVSLGGSLGRDEATGRGAFLVIQEYAHKKNWNPSQIRVAIQGFGNAGYHVAHLLHSHGYHIVAVSDSKGAIYSDKGFDVESLYQQKQETRKLEAVYCTDSICSLVDHEKISNEELLELDVDLLVPAALEGVIGKDNVDRIQARTIAEVANGPILGDVDETLFEKGITVIPDILVNAGGVIVSYFEWVQNRQSYPWSLEKVRNELADTLNSAFTRMWDVAQDEDTSLRAAAYAVALRRIGDALETHGTQDFFSGSPR